MNFSLVGLYQKDSYGNIVFNGLYETIPVSYITFDSKYITTQFNYIRLNVRHSNQIPIIMLNASNSEFRGYITFTGEYQRYIKSYNFTLDGLYMKLNYTNFYFTGKYTASSQGYIKLDASEIKREYTVFSYIHHYIANIFATIGFTGVYVYMSNKAKEEPASISLINSYSNAKPVYFDVGGIETSASISVEANNTTGGFIYGDIKISVTNRITLGGLLNGSYDFRAEKFIDIAGIDSPIGEITTVVPMSIGGFLSYPSYFTAIKQPVGGFVSNVMYFKIRRDIKEYKFYDASLSIPLIFKNIKFKNYIQPFVFVDVSVMDSSKSYDIFGFENKVNYIWSVEDYRTIDMLETKTDIYYHILKDSPETSLIYGFKLNKQGYGIAYSSVHDLFVLPTAASTYLFEDTKDSYLCIKELSFNYGTNEYSTTESLPFTDDTYLCIEVNGQKTDFNYYVLENETSNNLFEFFSNMTIADMEDYKFNFLPYKNALSVCNTFNGNKLVANLHRYFYTSADKDILNMVLTSYEAYETNIGGMLYAAELALLDATIDETFSGHIPFSLRDDKENVDVINITETFGISLHIDYTRLNDIILLEIPFHTSATEGSPNAGGLILEANMFIGLEHIKDIVFPLCEFKAA